jgi:hypothetical protein
MKLYYIEDVEPLILTLEDMQINQVGIVIKTLARNEEDVGKTIVRTDSGTWRFITARLFCQRGSYVYDAPLVEIE